MNRKTKQLLGRIGGISLLAALALFANQYGSLQDNKTPVETATQADSMDVHFIDVGQGDSILIEENKEAMLIDAGENNKGNTVTDYLKAQNIKELKYVIGTHPHSDHIGGLDTVIDSFQVDKVILPDVTNNTETFKDLLDAIEGKNLQITKPVVGDQYSLGNASFTVIAPNSSSYDDMNNYSVGIRLVFGKTSFLFTGDAGVTSEKEMLHNGINLSSDVLKLAHHGSSTASCAEFLDAVDPSYAVICVGKDNDYGHPHVETLRAIASRNIKLYRTDDQGSIVFTSDGQNISVNAQEYKITESDLNK